jgi:hypothetical protein
MGMFLRMRFSLVIGVALIAALMVLALAGCGGDSY